MVTFPTFLTKATAKCRSRIDWNSEASPDTLHARGCRAHGILLRGHQLVATAEQQIGIGDKRLPPVVVGVEHRNRTKAAVLFPFGKRGDLITIKIDRAMTDDKPADEGAVCRTKQFRIGLQIVLENDIDQFGKGRVLRFAVLCHDGNQIGAGVGRQHLEQMAQGGGEEEDRILVLEGGSGDQAEDFPLLAAIGREKNGQFPFLGATGNEIGDQTAFRIDRLEKAQQISLVSAGNPGLQHRHQDFAKGRIIQFAALRHDGIGVGHAQVAGGLHPRGRGGLLENGDGLTLAAA